MIIMSAARSSTQSPQRVQEIDDSPPPYTPHPTDEITLEVGPTLPYQRPPQQPRRRFEQQRQNRPLPRERELSDFARDFYAAQDSQSQSFETFPLPPAPRQSQAQNSIPDDGRPTRTPVPGHPLLNNGKTLVYPPGYECQKCHNTGYKSYDPSNPCRKCWEKYSKPYSGPILYATWGPGPSLKQRPLLNLRSSSMDPRLSLSRSITSIVNQARNDLSSYPGRSAWRSFAPPSSPSSSQVYPSPASPPLPPRPQSHYDTTPANDRTSYNHSRNSFPPSAVLEPGDPRIGGRLCSNCYGCGRTLGFLMLSDRTCDLCGGMGRLL
ncbi:hypothetical protein BJ322DRAFT_1089393 [Thelephora terrestris]|uniref:Uncharacterized protein n=1 Tax=Thelephora terrestris TaxID=56493 RepID=A0A9P6H4D0_9AGAM|nr:hypothetical protein BJ322DRAFT_1089393 [Thelephora terrestris]